MANAKQHIEPTPKPPCDFCQNISRCAMRGTLCRNLIYAWLAGIPAEECAFVEPVEFSYHGVKGVKA